MTAGAVFDYPALQQRRRQLCPPLYEPLVPVAPRFDGTASRHCDICPKAPDENCKVQCDQERARATSVDGIIVT
jgi:hypothetical protein